MAERSSAASFRRFWVGLATLAALTFCPHPAALGAQEADFHRLPPASVVTAEACGECHVSEFEVWRGTPHATGFKTLHRKEAAEAIARKMGYRLIKRDSPCLACHYTTALEGSRPRAVSGVSCESCHGAGRDWIETHNDYGAGQDFRSESAEHREQRIARSRAAGMRRPSDLYEVAANCFSCHTVPNERLVNVGGHTTGSTGFELVAWSQGEIRHNFLAAQRGGNDDNVERSIERKRLMYVVGRALELEYGLRGLATATGDGVYAKSMVRKVRNALAEVSEIGERATLTAARSMVASVRAVRVATGNQQELLNAADQVGAATRQLLDDPAPAQVAALDPLVLGLEDPLPAQVADSGSETTTIPVLDAVEATSTEANATPGSRAPAPPTAVNEGAAGATVTAAADGAAAADAPARPSYARKTRLRPRSKHRTIDAGACSGCHEEQNAWWFSDPHYTAADPFHEGDPKALQIARLYGLSDREMVRGDQLCMDCHGTVVTGKERREVWDGVSCQSCHGPAADFLEPHKEGDKSDGTRRKGYVDALRLGMRELQDLSTRAANCASCHYVTDPRLISAGHPTGAGFEIAERMPRIKHWQHASAPADALRTAFAGAIRGRGAIPRVELATLPSDASAVAAGTTATAIAPSTAAESSTTAGGGTRRASRTAEPPRVRRTLPPRQRPAGPSSSSTAEAGQSIDLPPWPTISPEMSMEQVLEIIQQRLALLYASVREE